MNSVVKQAQTSDFPADEFIDCGKTTGKDHFPPHVLRRVRKVFGALQLRPSLAAKLAVRSFFRPRARKVVELKIPVAEQGTHFVNNKRVVSYVFGEGPPVLLLHGWESAVGRVQELISSLVEAGYKVVTFDQPAHGNSAGKETDIVEITTIVEKLADRFGRFRAGIAHSFGGPCLANALRVGVDMDRAILVSSPASISVVCDKYIDLLALNLSTRRHFVSLVEKRFTPLDPATHLMTSRNLQASKVPCLVVHDVDDPVVPFESAQTLKQAHSQTRLIATQGLGHNAILREDAIIRRICDFVQNADPTESANS